MWHRDQAGVVLKSIVGREAKRRCSVIWREVAVMLSASTLMVDPVRFACMPSFCSQETCRHAKKIPLPTQVHPTWLCPRSMRLQDTVQHRHTCDAQSRRLTISRNISPNSSNSTTPVASPLGKTLSTSL